MAQQQQQEEEGWPLGLRPLNLRVGVVRRNRDHSGSISVSTLLTASPTSSASAVSSSDLDTESLFDGRSMTLGSLMGISSILERRAGARRTRQTGRTRNRKIWMPKAAWLFSLCCKLNTNAVITTNASSLGHFLHEERRAASSILYQSSPTLFLGRHPKITTMNDG